MDSALFLSDSNVPAACSAPSSVTSRRRRAEDNLCPDRKAARTSATDVSLPQLNEDILLCIFRFFVSPNGFVDGGTLRSCMVVCQKWKRVASCASLWKIPAGLLSRPEEVVPSPRIDHSIQSSLRIKEVTSQLSPDCNRTRDSFLGFTNLGRIQSEHSLCWSFQAVERATNQRYILKITKSRTWTKEVLKEAFLAHFLQGNHREFYATKENDDSNSANLLSLPNNLPRGIQILFGRYVLWYPYDTLSAISQQAFPDPCTSVLSSHWPLQTLFISYLPIGRITTRDEHAKSTMKHLLNLEGHPLAGTQQSARDTTPIFSRDCWAKLVDWVVEIIECFDLEDKLAFRALTYFDQFVSSSQTGRIRKDRYQLYAGTALLIAAKCESADMTPDISCNDIIFSADNTFSSEDMGEADGVLLSTLDWRLAMPTILDFVELYIQRLPLGWNESELRVPWMIRYLAELALQSPIHSLHLPSKIAACSVVIALFSLGGENNTVELWPTELESTTSFTWESLECCLMTLSTLLDDIQSSMPELSTIVRRYRRATRGSVAWTRIRAISSFATLTASRNQHRRRFVPTDRL